MSLKLTELQQVTLRDILVTSRLPEESILDVFRMLSEKSENAQFVFYYRACGLIQQDIGDRLGMSQAGVYHHLTKSLAEIREYLKEGLLIKP